GTLPGGEISLTLQQPEEWLGRAGPGAELVPRFAELVVGNQVEAPGHLGDPGSVGYGHASTAGNSRPGRQRLHPTHLSRLRRAVQPANPTIPADVQRPTTSGVQMPLAE